MDTTPLGAEAPQPGRFRRAGLLVVLYIGVLVLALGWISETSALVRATVPARTAVVLGIALGLQFRFISQRLAEQSLFWTAVVVIGVRTTTLATVGPYQAGLTWVTTAMILGVLSLLVAPTRRRHVWAGTTITVTSVAAGIVLIPDHMSVFLMCAAFLAMISALIATLESQARASERTWAMAFTDDLTDVHNRRALQHHLGQLLSPDSARPIISATRHTLIMVDLDHFKALNDTEGHEAGDEALRQVAIALSSAVREQDLVGRWGGEEFVIVLPDTEMDVAMDVAHRLRHAVTRLTPVTASFGIAVSAPGDTPVTLLGRADRAMYAAKEQGRDRIEVAGDDGRDLAVGGAE